MGKYNLLKSTFSHGELSPKLEGRSDVKEYGGGLALFENFLTMKSGGAAKRQGTRYVATIGSSLTEPIVIPFEISKTETYLILLNLTATDPHQTPTAEAYQVIDNLGVLQTFVLRSELGAISPTLDRNGFYYSQVSDVIFITHTSSEFRPIFIARILDETDGLLKFVGYRYDDEIISNDPPYQPVKFVIEQAKKVPYLDTNINAEIKFNPTSTAIGFSSLQIEDSLAVEVLFLTAEHLGAQFKVTHGSTTGTFHIRALATLEKTILHTTGVDIGADELTTTTTHGYTTGDKIYFRVRAPNPLQTSSGESPGPLFPYFVIVTSTTKFKVASTKANALLGTALDITGNGGGTMTVLHSDGKTKIGSAAITITKTLGAATATDNWNESAWNYNQGWPRCNTSYESRLCWGGTQKSPDTIWMSRAGNVVELMSQKYADDTSTVIDSDPLFFAIGGDRIPLIQWMSGGNVLQVGTLSQEYIISGGDNPITALGNTLQVKQQTGHGGVSVRPFRIGNTILFVGRDSKKIRNYLFNVKNGSYISQNLNILSDDIIMSTGAPSTASGTYSNVAIKQLAFQASTNVLWVLTSRNMLVSVTYDVDSDIIAWSRHIIGGTDVKVHGIAGISSSLGDSDELWLTVGRTVDSATVYYLEKIGAEYNNPALNGDFSSENDLPFYSDSSLRVTDFGSPKTTFGGFSHLEGETVKVLADGVLHADVVVAGGNVVVSSAVEEVIAGLPYTAKLNSLDLDSGADFESASGNITRIDRLFLKLFNSFGGKIGQVSTDIEDIEYEITANNPLFSGGIRQMFNATPSEDSRVYIEHSDPLPFNLLVMTMRGVSYD